MKEYHIRAPDKKWFMKSVSKLILLEIDKIGNMLSLKEKSFWLKYCKFPNINHVSDPANCLFFSLFLSLFM